MRTPSVFKLFKGLVFNVVCAHQRDSPVVLGSTWLSSSDSAWWYPSKDVEVIHDRRVCRQDNKAAVLIVKSVVYHVVYQHRLKLK